MSRHQRIDTRFSDAELALVERVAGRRGIAPSAFVRGAACAAASTMEGRAPDDQKASATAKPSLTPEQVAVIDATRIEVKRAGVNLNQLMRASHQGVLDLGALAPVVEALAEQVGRAIEVFGGKGQP
ncbi:hypothetical protein [Cryobacterium psychrophilum]|uniref:MobC family plasmid mobilization relaxosome protein n=1 Tax=Cryobacterium psychrophilum TaxID=41988 RepID=A0A4Y8KMD6_9MICO|nr:hypothetical protein [Cryobacterium psychrophilum]TFD78849.1 hypothetical protein E3T53_08660 [Cryobacterium psychrophilum]